FLADLRSFCPILNICSIRNPKSQIPNLKSQISISHGVQAMSQVLSKLSPSHLPPTPSRRDMQIYKGYVILNQDQTSISYNFNIGRTRISQIVSKVKRWLAAGGSPTD